MQCTRQGVPGGTARTQSYANVELTDQVKEEERQPTDEKRPHDNAQRFGRLFVFVVELSLLLHTAPSIVDSQGE